MDLFKVVEDEINPLELQKMVVDPSCGAVNMFIGTVREITGDKVTKYLIYEAYAAMAEKMLAQIGQDIEKKWPGSRAAIYHRVGRLEIGDIAVVIAVASPHRNDSFQAARYAIEKIKEMVPIWKKEHYSDGEVWIGNQEGTQAYPNGKPEKE